jgi:hypothetical protein
MASTTELYTFTYTFACERGQDPADTLNQELYEIVVKSDDKVSDFGDIKKVTPKKK